MVDAKHILTLNNAWDVVLWKLPECKAVYHWTCFGQHQLALSPGRRYAVLRGDKALLLCDLRSGETRGRFPFPAYERNALQFLGGAFRPDGKEFAAILSFGTGLGPTPRRLVRWDATTGKVIDSYPTGLDPRTFAWCGDAGLLLDWTLLDLKQGLPVCDYAAPGGHAAHGTPDHRVWFTSATDDKGPAWLGAQTLPDETAKQASAQLADGRVRLVLRPGTKVSLELDFTGPAADPNYRRYYEEQMGHFLNNRGLIVAPGQPVRLRLSAKESDTGQKVQATLSKREGNQTLKGEPREVALKRLTCEFSLTDGQGQALMPPKSQDFAFRDLNLTYDSKEDPDAAAAREQSRQLWGAFSNWLYQVAPPSVLAREGEKAVPWPKTATLAPGR